MSAEELVKEGGCRCGRIRLRITKRPLLTMACHCKGCQRMSSSAFSLSAAIPTEGFEVIEGEPVIGGMRADPKHYFCGWCMSWMFTRLEGADWFVNLRSTMLDDASWITPFAETWTSEKLPWVKTTAVHSYEALPPMDAYEGLIKEYAGWERA